MLEQLRKEMVDVDGNDHFKDIADELFSDCSLDYRNFSARIKSP